MFAMLIKLFFLEHKSNADLDIYNAINVADSSRCIDDVFNLMII